MDSVELLGGCSSLADSTEWDMLVIPANDLPAKPEKYGRVVLSQSGRLAYSVAGLRIERPSTHQRGAHQPKDGITSGSILRLEPPRPPMPDGAAEIWYSGERR